MNRILASLLLTLAIPLAAHADDASHRAKALELITLLHTQQTLEHNGESIKSQLTSLASSTIGFDPPPQKKAEAEDFLKQADQVIDAKLGWASLEPSITDIYVKNFTEEQLGAILAFYKSPAGIALVANMQTINTQVQAFGSERLNVELKPQLVDLVNAFKAKEAAASTPPTPALAIPPAPATPLAPAK